MIREMTVDDVAEITQIHLSSWDKNILLTKLGKIFLSECFYGSIVTSRYAFGFVYCKENKIIGYATGFLSYPSFFKKNPKKTLGYLIALCKLITFKLSWKDILDAMSEARKYKNLLDPEYQLGALALRNEYKGTLIGRRAIMVCLNAVLNNFEKSKAKSVWAITYNQNIPMQKYLERLGFELIEEIKLRARVVLIYEKVLKYRIVTLSHKTT